MLYMNHQCSCLYLQIPPLMKPLSLSSTLPLLSLIFPPSPLSLWFPFSQSSLLIISSPGFEHIIALAKTHERKKNVSIYLKLREKKFVSVVWLFFFLLQYIIVVWQDQRGASVAYIKTRPRHLSIMIWKRRGLRQNAGNHNIAAICRSCAIQSAAGFNRSLNWHIAHEEGSAAPPSLSCYGHTHMQRPHTHVYSKSNCTHTSIKTIYVEWPRGELKLIAVICPFTTFSIGEWHSD